MFRKAELEALRLRKERLVAQSDANRRILSADWRRLQSRECWMNEAGDFLRRHPLWTATMATAAGTMAVKILRRPRTILSRVGDLGKVVSVAFSAWRLFNKRK